MAHKCTKEAFAQVAGLRTRYPWAVGGNGQIVIALFNYRAEAKQFAQQKPNDRVAYDASGVVFVEATPQELAHAHDMGLGYS